MADKKINNRLQGAKETAKTIFIAATLGALAGAYFVHNVDMSNAKAIQTALKSAAAPVASAQSAANVHAVK